MEKGPANGGYYQVSQWNQASQMSGTLERYSLLLDRRANEASAWESSMLKRISSSHTS
jgi:hypothetical protein